MCAKPSARMESVTRHLRKEYDIDGPELQELVQALQVNLTEIRGQLHETLRQKQWADLSRAGHSLKGVAANTGQADIQEIGRAIEKQAPEANEETLRRLIAAADALLAELGIE